MDQHLHRPASRSAARAARQACAWLLVVGLMLAGAARAAEPAGTASLVRGAVTAHVQGSTPRLLGPGSHVFAGDVVTTGRGSVAVLELADGTRMALRPDTVFRVDAFDTAPQRESALLSLFRGGLRAVTGFISKRRADAFRVRAPTATIGIRGTTFDVRVCEGDCAQDGADTRPVVGRVALARGNVVLATAGGVERAVRAGARLREGDTIRTGLDAFAILLLEDGSRASVARDSAFRVDRLRQDAAEPSRSEAVLSFLRGGLRMLTGAIARSNARGYQVRTPVATIGIRGTGFDLQCQGLCVSPPGAGGGPDSGDGMFAEVWRGGIDFDGQHPSSGGALFFSNLLDGPIPVPGLPRAFVVPRPDGIALPAFPPGAGAPPGRGVYLSCYEGQCTLRSAQGELELSGGQAGVLGEGEDVPRELSEIPEFQSEDPFLRALEPQYRRIFDLLGDPQSPQGEFECRV